MYLPRKIDVILENIVKDPLHDSILVAGMRQCGKTESIRQFGKKYFKHFNVTGFECLQTILSNTKCHRCDSIKLLYYGIVSVCKSFGRIAMKEFQFLDKEKRLVQYDENMGEVNRFGELKDVLASKSIEEQKKYFYLTWWAPHFKTSYTPLYEEDKPVIIKDNIIVGVVLGENLFLLVDTGISEEESSDNNGAGYKEYSEDTYFRFTRVALDVESCHYGDVQNERDFFESHQNLKEVVIDENVKTIGTDDVDCRVKYVGNISHWLSLEGYKSSLQEIHLFLNGDKEETTKVVIPDEVDCINRFEFANCVGIKEVVFPSTLVSIQPDAFHGCTSLVAIHLPDSLKGIHSDAFHGCTSLKEIGFPKGDFGVGRFAFAECKALKEVFIPSSCELMDYCIFYQCDENLKIKCAVKESFVKEKFSRSWNERYSDRDGSCYYDVEWVV